MWFWCYHLNSALSFPSWSVLTFCYGTEAVFFTFKHPCWITVLFFVPISFFKWKDINGRMPWFISDIMMTSGFVLCSFFHKSQFFSFLIALDCWANVIELCVTTPVLPEQHNKLGAHCIFSCLGCISSVWITLLLLILNSIDDLSF